VQSISHGGKAIAGIRAWSGASTVQL